MDHKTVMVLLIGLVTSACGGGDGGGDSVAGSSGVAPPNSPPVASFTVTPSNGAAPLAVQFDAEQPFLPQLQALVARIPLSPVELQTAPLLVVLPALNFIAALLLAELHGRMGYFPAILRIRPVAGSTPPRFEVAEILNLQAVRDAARLTRSESDA